MDFDGYMAMLNPQMQMQVGSFYGRGGGGFLMRMAVLVRQIPTQISTRIDTAIWIRKSLPEIGF